MRFSYLLILLPLFIASGLYGQSSLSGSKWTPKAELKELENYFEHYTLYKIDVRKSKVNISGDTPFLNLDFQDKEYELNLFQDNLMVRTESDSKPLLLGGSLRNGGLVSLTINDGFIYGFIKQGPNYLFIEPLSYIIPGADQDIFIMYDAKDVKEDGEHVCGVTETGNKTEKLSHRFMPISQCKIIELAIANTDDMEDHYGSVIAVENHNLGVLNNVQTHYRSEFDVNIEFDVIAHHIPTASSNNPFSPNTTTTNASTLLSNFRSWAQGTGNAGGGNSGGATGGFGVDYTMASIWTRRNIAYNGSSGVVGLAYTPGWHHLLEDYTTSSASLMIMVAHEKGHNFNAGHDASGSDFIMAPSVTITDEWSTSSKSSINTRVNAQNYLDNCSTLGAPSADFFQSTIAVCNGSSVEFEEQSQYVATRTWDFYGGSPLTSTDEKETVTYNTNGLYAIKLVSSNSAGSDTKFRYVDVQSSPPTPCTPTGTGGSGGITGVRLTNVSTSSTTTGIYDDNSCSDVATVAVSTSYDLIVGVQGVTRLRYFADYNDDGDFTDTGEASSTFNFSGNGNLTVNLTTPSNPTKESILRFRIIVSTASIGSDGCTSPTTGQVEDYGLYFEGAQVFGCTDATANNYDSNATIDDGSCVFGNTWYADTDGDNFGDAANSMMNTTQPPGFVADNTDCDDTDANIYPGASEICDGVDNNCDGNIDEGVKNTYYEDSDGDGYGDSASTTEACTTPSGYVTDDTDCDDSDSNVNPGATEVCDDIDNDCDGNIDEGVKNTYYEDSDGDGYGDSASTTEACTAPTGYVTDDTDCDDSDSNVYPGATEVCDGIDNDCDSNIDEGVKNTYYEDADGDGYGDVNSTTQDCSAPTGYVTNDTDCDDNDANKYPSNTEVCDGKDNDCDSSIDEGVKNTYYKDNDGDGYGDSNTTTQACSTPTGYVSDDTDCDDNDDDNYPGNTEVCDGSDNDCDGIIDEGCSGNTCDGSYLIINTVTQNTYRAFVRIESSAIVDGTNNILFAAGSEIELKPGFEVISGTDFEARIEPCTNTITNDPSNSRFQFGWVEKDVMEFFGENTIINITIIDIDNVIHVGASMTSDQVEQFITDNVGLMNKGAYKIIFNDFYKEMILDVIVLQ